jgi:hypothetical protein
MKNIILIIAFFGCISTAYCQTFKGTVYDRSTDSTICFAIVFINGTSVGTYSDIHGNFELDISKYSSRPITISMLGYYSVTFSEKNFNKINHIYLTPKIKELQEVIVIADLNREANLKIFKREFLGESSNSLNCKILNENDIYLSYNDESATLKAVTSKPIIIQNKALGYTITYYLDKFTYLNRTTERGDIKKIREKFETMTLQGNYMFKDDILSFSESEKRKVEERRRYAYLGSRMHFFRLLYSGNLQQKGKHKIVLSDNTPVSVPFTVSSNASINANFFVIKKDSLSGYMKNVGELTVKYRMHFSTININMATVYFEKNGYFDPVGVTFLGEMSKQRIGDLLPFEYINNHY